MLKWIHDNSTLVNILFTILCGISGWLLYRKTYYREKRSAALFGFFVRFDMLLAVLQRQIEVHSEGNAGPFALMYTADARSTLQLLLPDGTVDKTIKLFSPIAKELKSLLLEAENNVYPKSCKKKDWYDSQIILLHFALMITDRLDVETIAPACSDCQNRLDELKKAVNELRNILERVKY